jgi:shikimate kinase
MVITLIGYRGSGKSALSENLAKRIGWKSVDADLEIERQAGRSIREIFADSGEETFRKLEREVMVELLQRDRTLIAAGGGAILNEETRNEMKQAGPVVWLNGSAEILWKRIHGDAQTTDRRPNLTDKGGIAEVETLLAQREPLYRECASVIIETDSRTLDELADSILAALREELPEGTCP